MKRVLEDASATQSPMLEFLQAVEVNDIVSVNRMLMLNSYIRYIPDHLLREAYYIAIERSNIQSLRALLAFVDPIALNVDVSKVRIKHNLFECFIILNKCRLAYCNEEYATTLLSNMHFSLLYELDVDEMVIKGRNVSDRLHGYETFYNYFVKTVNALLPYAKCRSITDLYESLYDPDDAGELVKYVSVDRNFGDVSHPVWLKSNISVLFNNKVMFVNAGLDEVSMCTSHALDALNCHQDGIEATIARIQLYYKAISYTDNELAIILPGVAENEVVNRFSIKDTWGSSAPNGGFAHYFNGVRDLSVWSQAKFILRKLQGIYNFYSQFDNSENHEIHALLRWVNADKKFAIKLYDILYDTDDYNDLLLTNLRKRFEDAFDSILRNNTAYNVFNAYPDLVGTFMLVAAHKNRSDILYYLIKNLYDPTELKRGQSPLFKILCDIIRSPSWLTYRITLAHVNDKPDRGYECHDLDAGVELEDIHESKSLEMVYEFCNWAHGNESFGNDEYAHYMLEEWGDTTHYHILHYIHEVCIKTAINFYKKVDGNQNDYNIYKIVIDDGLEKLGLSSVSNLYRTIYPKEDIDVLYHSLPVALKHEADQDLDWFRLSPEIFFEKKVSIVKRDCRAFCIAFYKALPRELIELIANFVVTEGLTYKEQVMIAASSFTKADVDSVKIYGVEKLSEEAMECVARLNVAQKNLPLSFLKQ